jgi:hypothetical protein
VKNVPSVVFASGVHIRGGRSLGVAATVALGACRWLQRNEQRGQRYHHHDQHDRGKRQCRRKHWSVVESSDHLVLPFSIDLPVEENYYAAELE